jgi:hypothetical protein
MLLFLALAAMPSSVAESRTSVTSSVRILAAVRASAAQWDRSHADHRREITVTERDGRKTRLRVIEFE